MPASGIPFCLRQDRARARAGPRGRSVWRTAAVFPVFSKPITNLKGMGVGSRVPRSEANLTPAICGCRCSWVAMSAPTSHPPPTLLTQVRQTPGGDERAGDFPRGEGAHEDKEPKHHAIPPGGFRLAVINGFSLLAGAGRARASAHAFSGAGGVSPVSSRDLGAIWLRPGASRRVDAPRHIQYEPARGPRPFRRPVPSWRVKT